MYRMNPDQLAGASFFAAAAASLVLLVRSVEDALIAVLGSIVTAGILMAVAPPGRK